MLFKTNIGDYYAGGDARKLAMANGSFYITGNIYDRYNGYYGITQFLYEMSYNQVVLTLNNKNVTTLTPLNPSAILSIERNELQDTVNVFSSTESYLNF